MTTVASYGEIPGGRALVEEDDAISVASTSESSAPASRYSSISSGISGLFMTYRDESPSGSNVSIKKSRAPSPDGLALPCGPQTIIPELNLSLSTLELGEAERVGEPAERVEQWLGEQESTLVLPEDHGATVVEPISNAEDLQHGLIKGLEQSENPATATFEHIIVPPSPYTQCHPQLNDIRNGPLPYESALSVTSYVVVSDDEARDSQPETQHPFLAGTATLGRKVRRFSHDVKSASPSSWLSLRLRRSSTNLKELASPSTPTQLIPESAKGRTRLRRSLPENRTLSSSTPRKSASSSSSSLFKRSPLPPIFLSSTPDRLTSLQQCDTPHASQVEFDEFTTPKASRTRPRMWPASVNSRSNIRLTPSPTLIGGVESLMSPPRLSTSTDGTYTSSFDESSSSLPQSSPSTSLFLSSSGHASKSRFSLRHLGYVSESNTEQAFLPSNIGNPGPDDSPNVLFESTSESIRSFLPNPSLFSINIPSPSSSIFGKQKGQSNLPQDSPRPRRSRLKTSRIHLPSHSRAGSTSTNATTVSLTSSRSLVGNLEVARSSDVDNSSRILRDLTLYSNSVDATESDIDVESDVFCSSSHRASLEKSSRRTMKFGSILTSPTEPFKSAKKRLLVKGVKLDDKSASKALRRWAEKFGKVGIMMHDKNSDIHIDFESAEVADMVCCIRTQVYISGVGSVGLSWYTGRMPL